MPAMGIPATKYDPLLKALAQQGLVAAVFDLRGHGASSVRPSRTLNFSYAELVEQDLPAAIVALQDKTKTREVVLMGHSLGGQASLLSLANQGQDITSLILVASCSVYHRGWQWPANIAILVFSQVCYLAALLWGYFPGHVFRFGGNEARGVMRDWARNARSGVYRLATSTVDYEALLQQVSLPILAINFTDDQFAPQAATKNLVGKLSADAPCAYLQLDGAALETSRADHFTFLRAPQHVAKTVAEWLNTHALSNR